MARTPQRLDIQGLRALAVLLVVVFHLSPAALPGGYIGVDVFFVISGFLITAHLLREVGQTGTIKLLRFWARRARRLLPAALFVLAVSAVSVLLFLPRSILVQNLTEITAATVYVLNWSLAANSVDYLAADNSPSIAQHYWSLSVEEQFYIVWPLLILLAVWLGLRVFKARPNAMVAVLLILVTVASLTWSILETFRSQPSAYFITTTRAWEFALGGIVGLLPALRWPQIARDIASWVMFAVILVSAFQFNAETAFPGWVALAPVLATAFLLWVGDSQSAWSPQYISRAGPVQFLGDISYSVYLWHWPLIVVFIAVQGRAPGWKWAAVLLVVTVVLGAITKRWIEDPVRRAPGLLGRSLPTFALTAAGMAAVLVLSLVPTQIALAEERAYQVAVADAVSDPGNCFGAHAINNECTDIYARGGLVNPVATTEDHYNNSGPVSTDKCVHETVRGRLQVTCDLNQPDDPTSQVVLIGDSHADHFAAPLERVALEAQWRLTTERRSGCSPFSVTNEAAKDPACASWGAQLFDRLVADPTVDTVIVAIRTPLYGESHDQAATEERLRALLDAGKQVVVLRTVPGMMNEWPIERGGISGPECVETTGGNDPCAWVPPSADWLIDTADVLQIPVVDTWEAICADGTCHSLIGGTIVYFDDNHLATTFALTLTPWLREELGTVL